MKTILKNGNLVILAVLIAATLFTGSAVWADDGVSLATGVCVSCTVPCCTFISCCPTYTVSYYPCYNYRCYPCYGWGCWGGRGSCGCWGCCW